MAVRSNDCAVDQVEFRLQADLCQVRAILRHCAALFAQDLDNDDLGALELTLAEVLNNIVEHAYEGHAPGPIVVSLVRRPAAIDCRIEDWGKQMPGLKLPLGQIPAVTDQLPEVAEGGWGWSLIRAMTTDLSYIRTEERNLLSFRLPLGSPKAKPLLADHTNGQFITG
jgi:serine/threonine-protein kinase RsbW